MDRSRPSAIITVQLSFGGKLCCRNSAPVGKKNQQGILGRCVCSCLLEDGEAAERRAGSGREAGGKQAGARGELHAGSLGSVSRLPSTHFLSVHHGVAGMGRDTWPSRVHLGCNLQSLLRFISDTFCTWKRACYPSSRPGRALESYGSSAKLPSLWIQALMLYTADFAVWCSSN